jgi:hypothetical protein
LNDSSKTKVFAHRALILFRLVLRELSIDINENLPLSTLLSLKQQPDFIRNLAQVQCSSDSPALIPLHDVHSLSAFSYFLEFLYCDKFISDLTCVELRKVVDIFSSLNLAKTHSIIRKKYEFAKVKIEQRVKRDQDVM